MNRTKISVLIAATLLLVSLAVVAPLFASGGTSRVLGAADATVCSTPSSAASGTITVCWGGSGGPGPGSGSNHDGYPVTDSATVTAPSSGACVNAFGSNPSSDEATICNSGTQYKVTNDQGSHGDIIEIVYALNVSNFCAVVKDNSQGTGGCAVPNAVGGPGGNGYSYWATSSPSTNLLVATLYGDGTSGGTGGIQCAVSGCLEHNDIDIGDYATVTTPPPPPVTTTVTVTAPPTTVTVTGPTTTTTATATPTTTIITRTRPTTTVTVTGTPTTTIITRTRPTTTVTGPTTTVTQSTTVTKTVTHKTTVTRTITVTTVPPPQNGVLGGTNLPIFGYANGGLIAALLSIVVLAGIVIGGYSLFAKRLRPIA